MHICRARAEKLGRLGLSAAKIKTLKFIARAIAKGRLDFDGARPMPGRRRPRALTALHGIGPWTTDIYLLFCLGHGDAWPAGDLAVQEAARIALALEGAADREGMAVAGRRRGGPGAAPPRICSGPITRS